MLITIINILTYRLFLICLLIIYKNSEKYC